MDFSAALLAVKNGCAICRTGWNGKDMYLVYKPGYDAVPCNEAHAKAHNISVGSEIKYLPYLEMKTSDGSYVPWLASQTDILSEDWMIKEE